MVKTQWGKPINSGPLSQILMNHRCEESSWPICDIGFTAGVFTPPSGEQDQTGRLYKFCYERHVCEDGRIMVAATYSCGITHATSDPLKSSSLIKPCHQRQWLGNAIYHATSKPYSTNRYLKDQRQRIQRPPAPSLYHHCPRYLDHSRWEL